MQRLLCAVRLGLHGVGGRPLSTSAACRDAAQPSADGDVEGEEERSGTAPAPIPLGQAGGAEAHLSALGYDEGREPIRRDWRTFEPACWTPWVNWRMKKDFKRRQLVEEHAEQRLRWSALAQNTFLPDAVKESAAEQVAGKPGVGLPRYSDPALLKRRCNVTSRGHGNVYRYRVSRWIYRENADHGRLSGVIRAKWE